MTNNLFRILLVALLAVACAERAGAQDERRIRVACCQDKGFCERAEDGSMSGIVPAWVTRIASRAGWRVEWVDLSYREAKKMLAAGELDMIGAMERLSDDSRSIGYGCLPIGSIRFHLFARKTSPFEPGNFRAVDGCAIGALDGFSYESILDWAMRRGVTLNLRKYSTIAELEQAFARGEVTVVLSDMSQAMMHEKVLFSFPSIPLYVGVSARNAVLREEVDRALIDIVDDEPQLANRLRRTYFPDEGRAGVPYTSAEREWISAAAKGNRVFTVDVSPDIRGLGKLQGRNWRDRSFLGLYIDELTELTGLEFQIIPTVREAEALDRFKEGVTAVWIPYGAKSVPVVGQSGGRFTEHMPQACCTRRTGGVDLKDPTCRLAVRRDDGPRIAAYTRFGYGERMVHCASDEDCIRAVLGGRADCAVMNYRTARQIALQLGVNDRLDIRLADSLRYEPELPVLIGPTADPLFQSIMGKAIQAITHDRVVELIHIAEARASGGGAVSREQMLKLTVAFLFVLAVAVLLTTYLYRRRIAAALMRSEELRRLAESSLKDATRASEAASEARERAELAVKTRSNFLATVSHEIRTPLNAVIGYAEFISEPGIGAEKVAEYAKGISYSANALLSLINDVLDLSKFESGRTEGLDMRTGACDLAALAAEMKSVFGVKAAEKKIAISFALSGGSRRLKLDETRLRQLLLNLVGNAVKFTDRGGVEVTIGWSDGTFQLVVKDSGIGISPRGLKLIFDPFSQDMEGRRGKVYSGTGLGLSIVKRLVEASGGTVTVDSVLGQGSTFRISIPGVEALEEKAAAAEGGAETLAPGRIRDIVIVDDIEINRKILAMYCKALGLPDPKLFASGAEVLAYLSTGAAVDLVLSDLWMPGMDGSVLARRIAEERPRLPVIAVTADTDAGATYDMSAFADFLSKPVTREKLQQLLVKFAGGTW